MPTASTPSKRRPSSRPAMFSAAARGWAPRPRPARRREPAGGARRGGCCRPRASCSVVARATASTPATPPRPDSSSSVVVVSSVVVSSVVVSRSSSRLWSPHLVVGVDVKSSGRGARSSDLAGRHARGHGGRDERASGRDVYREAESCGKGESGENEGDEADARTRSNGTSRLPGSASARVRVRQVGAGIRPRAEFPARPRA